MLCLPDPFSPTNIQKKKAVWLRETKPVYLPVYRLVCYDAAMESSFQPLSVETIIPENISELALFCYLH